MTRYGYAIRMGGDPEISGALAEGIREGSTRTSSVTADAATPSPEGKAMLEADRIAEAWIDQQRLKRSIGNHKTPEDYALMTVKARGDYANRRPGPVRTMLLQMMGLFALFLDWEERCWRGEA